MLLQLRLRHCVFRNVLNVLFVGAVFGALAYGGIALTRYESRIAAFWPANAMLAAVLLRRRDQKDGGCLSAAFICNILANLFAGDPIGRAIALSACNSLEIWITVWGARRLCAPIPDVTDLRQLMIFSAIGGVLAPVISGSIACQILSGPGAAFDVNVWLRWAAADGLGMLIVAPVLMIFIDAWRDPRWVRAHSLTDWLLVGGFGMLGAAVPFSGLPFPTFFLAGPFVILAAFRLGVVGTAMAVVHVVVVATAAAASGYGPMRFLDNDLFSQLVVLQAFMVAIFGMSLPVAAALAGRDRLRDELDGNRAFIESILATTNDVVFRTDALGRWTFLNPAWRHLTGRPVEQCLGLTGVDLIHADDMSVISAMWPDIAAGKIEEATLPLRIFHLDGEYRPTELSGKRLVDEAGRFAGITGTIRDHTERKRTEHELAARDEQLNLLARHATDSVLRFNTGMICLYASPSSREVLGAEPENIVGKQFIQLVDPDDREAFLRSCQAISGGGSERAVITFRCARRDAAGEDIWLEANCGVVSAARRRSREIIASVRDITARKKLELELQRARAHAEAADRAKSTFLANMSHEIRTPMHGVMGFTELLLASELNDFQRRHVRLIADSGSAMMRLLGDILDISKVEAGRMEIADEIVDISRTLDACAKLLTPAAEQKGLALHLILDPRLPETILGDGLRLSQIVLNLLGNAIKFTGRGAVTLSAAIVWQEQRPFLEIAVADTGLGISPAHQVEIFDQFVQIGKSGDQRGAGLGLAISSQLARLMGGEISLRSEVGKGSTFFVRLPAKTPAQTSLTIVEPANAIGQRPSARILVAEDNGINRDLLDSMLIALGYESVIVNDGDAAVAAALTSAFDLLVMDIRMPGMNGLDACRAIRQRLPAKGLPIIAMTANAYAEDHQACLDAGMQECLVKPIGMAELDGAVRRWIARDRSTSLADDPVPKTSLKLAYRARKAETLEKLDALIRQGQLSGTSVEELATIAHKLAGVAAMFEEPGVGEDAATLVETLEGLSLAELAESRTVLRSLHRSMAGR